MQVETMPVQQSYVVWIFSSLGPFAVLLPLAGLLSFVLALIIVARGKGPMAAVALLLIVHVPMLIGFFGAVQGAINSYSVIAMSAVAVKPSEVAAGISTALVSLMVGMVVTAPGYAVAALGGLARSFPAGSNPTSEQ